MNRKSIESTTIVGIFGSVAEAEAAMEALAQSGIRRDAVGVLANVQTGGQRWQVNPATQMDNAIPIEESTGAASTGTLGQTMGLASLGIPNFGTILAAGPILSALRQVENGTIAGGLVGGLIDLSISRQDAASYAEGIRRGMILVAVRVVDQATAEQAITAMESTGAKDLDQSTAEWRASGWTAPAVMRAGTTVPEISQTDAKTSSSSGQSPVRSYLAPEAVDN